MVREPKYIVSFPREPTPDSAMRVSGSELSSCCKRLTSELLTPGESMRLKTGDTEDAGVACTVGAAGVVTAGTVATGTTACATVEEGGVGLLSDAGVIPPPPEDELEEEDETTALVALVPQVDVWGVMLTVTGISPEKVCPNVDAEPLHSLVVMY